MQRAWALLLVLGLAGGSSAAELVVFSAGAAKEGVAPLIERFEKASGNKVSVSFGTMGLIQQKLAKGERADVLIVAAEVADEMQKRGVIVGDSARPLAGQGRHHRRGGGREAASCRIFRRLAAVKQALLNARSIVYIDPAKGTSGKHLVTVFERLGVTAQVNAKATLGEGGNIVEPVGEGKIELGLHQISEILPVKGVKLVGPLPEALQKWTVYTAALTPGSAEPRAARELIRFLTGADARAVFASRGYAPVE